jgi:small subunit ribosomal protein S3
MAMNDSSGRRAKVKAAGLKHGIAARKQQREVDSGSAHARGAGKAVASLQNVRVTGLRPSVTRNWASRWYAGNTNFSAMLNEDLKARAYLKSKLRNASVGRIVIERPSKNARVTIYSSRPGVVIGKNGEDIDVMKSALTKIMGVPVNVNIEEIHKPEIDSQLIADSIARQLGKRIMFRRAMKRAMQNAMRLGALGIKIMSAGRLNGLEIARKEWYCEGRVPLHTLRADIDYGASEASTTYGIIGVKVWVYKDKASPRSGVPVGPDAVSSFAESSRYSSDAIEHEGMRIANAPEAASRGPQAHAELVTSRVIELTSDAAEDLMRALPEWIAHQQATDVKRLQLTLGGDISPTALVEFLARESPAPFGIGPIAPLTAFDPLKAYSVIGRFASGAVRTIGRLQLDAAGRGAVSPFGYWSLIDPDNEQLDPGATTLIESTIDFLAVEVI